MGICIFTLLELSDVFHRMQSAMNYRIFYVTHKYTHTLWSKSLASFLLLKSQTASSATFAYQNDRRIAYAELVPTALFAQKMKLLLTCLCKVAAAA
jgi:hypothetical protein